MAGNLIDNALDAVANADHAAVAVEVTADDEEVRVVVTDTGPGVPQGAVDQVFARGYSTKSSAVAGGRGVGLALVRTICERRGGWVRVRSGDEITGGSLPDGAEIGAVFTAVLGRRVAPADGDRLRGGGGGVVTDAGAQFDVLVVDDDFMVAKLHSRFLATQAAFRVVGVAHNGADALTAISTLRPDLILLDVHLPDMSGLDVLRAARDRHPEVEVILITAAHELDVVRRAWQGGALSYLVKPFEYTALAERLEHFRSNRAMLAAPGVDQGQIDQLFGVAGAVRRPFRPSCRRG